MKLDIPPIQVNDYDVQDSECNVRKGKATLMNNSLNVQCKKISKSVTQIDDFLQKSDTFNSLRKPQIKLKKLFRSMISLDSNKGKFDKKVDYESHNYDTMENEMYIQNRKNITKTELLKQNMSEWCILFLIGVVVAFVATLVELAIEYGTKLKYKLISKEFNHCTSVYCEIKALTIWISINIVFVLIGSLIVTYWMPQAAGSGIPNIKSYLNGVRIRGLLKLQTLICKTFGIVFSVIGGLMCGKEGPMIHTGAIIAGGISQTKSKFFRMDLKILKSLQSDAQKRDFVACGTAAGVSAAFGAPIGGVMFSLEEGTSFYNPLLTSKMLFSSITATFTVNLLVSAFYGHLNSLSNPGLISFGVFDYHYQFHVIEVPIFLIMGIIGGILGSIINYMNVKITKLRMRYIQYKVFKMFECLIVAIVSGIIPYLLLKITHCVVDNGVITDEEHYGNYHTRSNCTLGSHNSISTILFQTPEGSLIQLLHAPMNYITIIQLIWLLLAFTLLTTWTYGLSVSCGIFIPCLLVGACWGRLVAHGVNVIIPWLQVNVGRYALIGAASQIGGNLRMTVSLSVILFECTGDITFVLPVVIVLIVAKMVGQCFTLGLYDEHIRLMKIPFLPWSPPNLLYNLTAAGVMSNPVIVFNELESVSYIKEILTLYSHSAFPIVRKRKLNNNMDNFVNLNSYTGTNLKKYLKRRKTAPSTFLDNRNSRSVKLLNSSTNENDDVDSTGIEINRKFNNFSKYGLLRGIILRYQLEVILEKGIYRRKSQNDMIYHKRIRLSDFNKWKFKTKKISRDVDNEDNLYVELTKFGNPTPFTVPLTTPLPRVFRLFRGLGLRHLIVTQENDICGIITRKELTRHL